MIKVVTAPHNIYYLNGQVVNNCGKMELSSKRTGELLAYTINCDALGDEVYFYKNTAAKDANNGIAVSEVKFFIKYSGKLDISTLTFVIISI